MSYQHQHTGHDIGWNLQNGMKQSIMTRFCDFNTSYTNHMKKDFYLRKYNTKIRNTQTQSWENSNITSPPYPSTGEYNDFSARLHQPDDILYGVDVTQFLPARWLRQHVDNEPPQRDIIDPLRDFGSGPQNTREDETRVDTAKHLCLHPWHGTWNTYTVLMSPPSPRQKKQRHPGDQTIMKDLLYYVKGHSHF